MMKLAKISRTITNISKFQFQTFQGKTNMSNMSNISNNITIFSEKYILKKNGLVMINYLGLEKMPDIKIKIHDNSEVFVCVTKTSPPSLPYLPAWNKFDNYYYDKVSHNNKDVSKDNPTFAPKSKNFDNYYYQKNFDQPKEKKEERKDMILSKFVTIEQNKKANIIFIFLKWKVRCHCSKGFDTIA